jgi:hypothetical protein
MSFKNLLRIISPSLFLLIISCGWFGPPVFHDIKANITSIEKESDTSVVVKFEVYSSGDADDCHFWVVHDTQPGFSYRRHLIKRSHYKCDVGGLTEVSISGIVRGQKYYYQLGEWGNWDVSGQTSSRVVTIGDQKEYVLN